MPKQFDLVIIGAGPGGYVAAIRAAQRGATVAVVEKAQVGGVCLNCGCIPTKALITSAEHWRTVQRISDFGLRVENPSFDWGKIQQRKDNLVRRLRLGTEQLLKSHGVEVIAGQGEFIAAGTVRVQQESGALELKATRGVIIATGSTASTIPGVSFDQQRVLDNIGMLQLTELPQSLAVLGGGVVGCEFGCLMRSFGVEVTIIEMLPQLLPGEDEEVSQVLLRSMQRMGIKTLLSKKVTGVTVAADQVSLALESGENIAAEKLLIAVGRRPLTENLGLERIGLNYSKKGIATDDQLRTNVPGVYAIGDVTGQWPLAHVASREGKVAVATILGGEARMDYDVIPAATFTVPEVASIGPRESALKAQGREVKSGKFPYRASGRALTLSEHEGLVKVVCDAHTNQLLSATAIGWAASELLGELSILVTQHQTLEHFSAVIHAHPTLSEMTLEAAEDALGEAIHLPKK